MSDIIDINVGETIEEVTINVTDNLITVNINKITGGGGGTQTLAQTLVLGNITDGENISISNGDAIILDNGSMLKKGTIDAGNGGSKGISQICGVGFEHKWEAGRLYIMNDGGTIIREVSHNLTYTPTVTDDVTKGFVQNTRWILDNGDVYLCTDPTEGAAVWELVNTGTTPTLQEVTDEGNTTTNDIEVNSLGLYSNAVVDYGYLSWADDLGLSFKNHTTQEVLNANKSDSSLSFINADDFTAKLDATLLSENRNFLLPDVDGTLALTSDIPAALVTSVGLTMPSAFSVTNSPITSSGDIAVTGAGLVSQYVRGDGTLANFPNSTGGGSSVNYYLNGSVSQGTFGGDTYYEMSKTPILGAGTNFTRTNGQGNGYIASFITDAGDPSFLNIPAGNWNVEFYFQSSSTGGSPQFYGEIYKVSATNVFTLVASGSANPEGITNGTTVDQYFTSIPVPQTSLLITDRLAVRIYVITSGRTITLHTENGNLCEVLTTFTTGLTALNGLTQQVQNLAVGTSGTDFAISSATDTHTFNLPTASASNRGALSSTDWSTFNGKQNALPAATTSVDGYLTATDWNTFNNKGYAINLGATSTTYLANNTYYFGIPTQAGTTASAQRKILIPKTGTIKGGQIYIRTSVGTTSENWTLSIRLNNTTNTTFATVGTTALEKIFGTTSLNISVVAGDFIEIITSTPAWVTGPGASFIYGTIIIQ